jgi:hypothetical protein
MENGGNNPPIPEMVGEPATGAVFSSTDIMKLDQPAIAGPRANNIEGFRHANVAQSGIMSYLKSQHLAFQRFSWSTSQLPGTLLLNVPITPLRANSIISYLSGIYNCWNGGLEYQAKVAGTGFHAGALGLARIPPNIDPTTLKTVEQFTAFEYSVIDPKTLEAVSKDISDQRPVMFHYMSNDFANPNNIGGHFVIFVLLRLNTSSTGTNQIDVQVFNKLAPDFNFIQVIPPAITGVVPTDTLKWSTLFETPNLHLSPVLKTPISTITFQANTYTSSANCGLVSLAGSPIGSSSYLENTIINNVSILGFLFYATTATNLIPVLNSPTQYNRNVQINGNSPPQFNSIFTNLNPILATSNVVPLNAATTTANAAPGGYYVLGPIAGNQTFSVTYPGVTAIVPPSGESLVTFETNYQSGGPESHLTTTFFEQVFKTGKFIIAGNEAVLLQLSSKSSGLPIGYLKLYYNGYFTTNSVLTAVTYDLNDLSVTFLEYVSAASPFPSLNLSMLTSRQQLQMRQMIREARNLHLHIGD